MALAVNLEETSGQDENVWRSGPGGCKARLLWAVDVSGEMSSQVVYNDSDYLNANVTAHDRRENQQLLQETVTLMSDNTIFAKRQSRKHEEKKSLYSKGYQVVGQIANVMLRNDVKGIWEFGLAVTVLETDGDQANVTIKLLA